MSRKIVASQRRTSNSRGPGQEGAVYSYAVGLRICENGCGAAIPNLIERGWHGHHHGPNATRLNCVGAPIQTEQQP